MGSTYRGQRSRVNNLLMDCGLHIQHINSPSARESALLVKQNSQVIDCSARFSWKYEIPLVRSLHIWVKDPCAKTKRERRSSLSRYSRGWRQEICLLDHAAREDCRANRLSCKRERYVVRERHTMRFTFWWKIRRRMSFPDLLRNSVHHYM